VKSSQTTNQRFTRFVTLWCRLTHFDTPATRWHRNTWRRHSLPHAGTEILGADTPYHTPAQKYLTKTRPASSSRASTHPDTLSHGDPRPELRLTTSGVVPYLRHRWCAQTNRGSRRSRAAARKTGNGEKILRRIHVLCRGGKNKSGAQVLSSCNIWASHSLDAPSFRTTCPTSHPQLL